MARVQNHIPYPFTAIVGQEEMKLALILNAVEPLLGGVLIMGHRGTGKSTAVRALADLLPSIDTVAGCVYGCDPDQVNELCASCRDRRRRGVRLPRKRGSVPVVELPLGATEDRVCGTLDIERALREGVKAFEPGLLARAHRGFLYIDEVNLLEDHLVDLLLDAAASGRNVVERDGISVSHPARFVLAGSGNPDEGDLRPQMVDRFGLHARVATVSNIPERIEIVRRRERFESDPSSFFEDAEPQQARLRRRIVRARRLLAGVSMADELLGAASELCLKLHIEGHRGELTIMRAARALAAYEARKQVGPEDVRNVAVISLAHRLRREVHGDVDPAIRIRHTLEAILPAPGRVLLATGTA